MKALIVAAALGCTASTTLAQGCFLFGNKCLSCTHLFLDLENGGPLARVYRPTVVP